MPHARMIVSSTPVDRGLRLGTLPDAAAPHAPRWRWVGSWLWTSLVLAASACALIWVVVQPIYKVHALLQVDPGGGAVVALDALGYQRQMAATELRDLTSETVLNETVKSPTLRSLPSLTLVPDLADHIRRRVSIAQLPETQLIEVAMIGDAPEDMVPIVNTLVHTYLQRRTRHLQVRRGALLDSLTAERDHLLEQAADTGDRRRELLSAANALGGSLATLDARRAQLEQQRGDHEQARALAQARLSALQALDGNAAERRDRPEDLLAFLDRDRELTVLRQELTTLENSLLTHEREGRRSRHPQVRHEQQQLQGVRHRVAERERSLEGPYLRVAGQTVVAELSEIETAAAVIDRELETLAGRRVTRVEQVAALEDLDRKQAQVNHDLAEIRERIRSIGVDEGRRSLLTIHTAPDVPPAPNWDPRPRYLLVALAASVLLGAAVSLVRCRPGSRVATGVPSSARSWVGIETLAAAPGRTADPERALPSLPPLRSAVAAVLHQAGTAARCKMLTSVGPSPARAEFALEMARSLALAGRRVLLVDVDAARGRVSEALGLAGHPGVSNWIAGEGRLADTVQQGGWPNVSILPCGGTEPLTAAAIERPTTRAALRALFADFEDVIIDGPPTLPDGQALLWAVVADGAVLLVQSDDSAADVDQARRWLSAAVDTVVAGPVERSPDGNLPG